MQLDAGGIAKGYAADEALAILHSLGIRSALVAASGDLTFSDPPPGKPGWTVGVDSLDDAHKPFTVVLVLSNAAISTSGDTEQFLDINGKRFSHIIDPRTGRGLTQPITVTVYARHGIDADSLATALSVLGPEKGLPLIESRDGAAAIFVDHSPGGKKWTSHRFETLPHAP
jgi:thiamine biosynthesis lipoprotein